MRNMGKPRKRESKSKREITKVEGSLWTLLPAAAAIILFSWMFRRRGSGGGRKQSHQQQQVDDDNKESSSLPVDDDHKESPNTSLSVDADEHHGRKPGPIPLSAEVPFPASDFGSDEDDGRLIPEFADLSSRIEIGEALKLERFKVKPRDFMNVTTKQN